MRGWVTFLLVKYTPTHPTTKLTNEEGTDTPVIPYSVHASALRRGITNHQHAIHHIHAIKVLWDRRSLIVPATRLLGDVGISLIDNNNSHFLHIMHIIR